MKLCAIYNSWDDFDWLKISITNIRPLVEGVVVITSFQSNHFENRIGPDGSAHDWPVTPVPIFFRNKEPQKGLHPSYNEREKRNYGLDFARDLGYTHFICLDTDELYHPEQFLEIKNLIDSEPSIKGVVVPCNVYFKSPKLTIGRDITRVPFIHKITPTIKHEFNKYYPYSWEGNQIRIDPTRSLNINRGVIYTERVVMEHFSWVRSDYEKKIRNSTARTNLERSTILKDLLEAKEGYFCEFYQRRLERSTVDFGIPEI